jgi:hypothetical protein
MAVILNRRQGRTEICRQMRRPAPVSLGRKVLSSEVDRCYFYTLMPEFMADLLAGM